MTRLSPNAKTASSRKAPLPARERRIILRLASMHGASNIRVFGSYARGEQTSRSDLDLLVDLPAEKSLLDLIGLKLDLQSSLHREVDLLTEGGISPYLRDRILRDARPL